VRILMTADAVGGVWQYTTTLANLLADAHGVQVLVVACGAQPAAEHLSALVLGPRPTGGGVEVEHLPIPLEWEGADEQTYAQSRQQILELALHWRAQILHANEHHLGEIGSSGMPVLVVSHSDLCSWRAAVLGEAEPMVSGAYIHRVRIGLANAAGVVAPSTFAAGALCRWFGYSDVVRVIPNGVNNHPSALHPVRTIDAMIAGRLWDPAKNYAAFASAASRSPGRTFAAAGPVARPGESATMMPEAPIRYLGVLPRDTLRRTLAQSRLLVAPALYDPFGLVPVEAALAGCCLVLGDIPSYRDIWDDTAIYVEPRDPTALAAVLEELFEDVPRQRTMAERARLRAQKLYSAERMVAAYLSTYQRLALRHGMAP
jgi:glycogen(starch) synthase